MHPSQKSQEVVGTQWHTYVRRMIWFRNGKLSEELELHKQRLEVERRKQAMIQMMAQQQQQQFQMFAAMQQQQTQVILKLLEKKTK